MIISGKNSVFEALVAGKTINKVAICDVKGKEKIVELCKKNRIRLDFVSRENLDKLSSHHQGVVAEIVDYKYSTVDEILQNSKEDGHFIVILDGVQDPHNLGSIIRVCDCAGVDGLIIEDRRSASVNETVFKTSCGAVNHVKIARVKNINDVIRDFKKQNIWVYSAEAGGESVYKTSLTGNLCIVMGSEGFGVGELTKKLSDGLVSLPMFGKVNSLNVSTATSAIVYEALRQRRGK